MLSLCHDLSGEYEGDELVAPDKTRKSPRAIKQRPEPRVASKETEFDLGMALRSAYEDTVREAIPAEMLDLLSKLR